MKSLVAGFIFLCICITMCSFTANSFAEVSSASGNEGLLEGTYFIAAYENAEMVLVKAEMDGIGNGSLLFVFSTDAEEFPEESIPFTYTIDEEGRLDILITEEGEEISFTGIVDPDGRGFTATANDGVNRDIIIGFKSPSVASESLLDGEYYISGYDELLDWTFTANAVFGGDGTGSMVFDFSSLNEELPETVDFVYSFTGDGMLVVGPPDSQESAFTGLASPDGSGFILLGGLEPEDRTIITAYKLSSGATNAQLSGSYFMSGYTSEGGWLQKVDFDGDGNFTSEIIFNSFEGPESFPGTYSVSENGVVSVSVDDGINSQFLGVVSPDGSGFNAISTFDEYQNIVLGMKANEITTSAEHMAEMPVRHMLDQNYPNPFNPGTVITYHLPQNSDVTLEVFDLMGRKVNVLAEGTKPAGTHQVTFDASHLSSGTYIYRIRTGEFVQSRKLILIK